MKIVFLLLGIITMNTCGQKSMPNKTIITEFKYEASTRGSNYTCLINENDIDVISIGISDFQKSKSINNEQWSSLINSSKTIDVLNLENLIAPSNNSHTDRARIATLTIITPDSFYISKPFDEGNPPSQLTSLINNMLTITKTVD